MLDSECVSLGVDHTCYYYTGCYEKLKLQEEEGEEEVGDLGNENDPYANNFCGSDWLDAMQKCGTPCPKTNECTTVGETCWAATNCNKPLVELTSDMVVSLAGLNSKMEGADSEVFQETMLEHLKRSLSERKLLIGGVGVGNQTLVIVLLPTSISMSWPRSPSIAPDQPW